MFVFLCQTCICNAKVHFYKYMQFDLSVPKSHCSCENESRMSKKSFSFDKILLKDRVIAISEFQCISFL